jgi:hypothetical protein
MRSKLPFFQEVEIAIFSEGRNYDHEIEIVIFHEIKSFYKILLNCSGDRKGLGDPRRSLFKGFFYNLT